MPSIGRNPADDQMIQSHTSRDVGLLSETLERSHHAQLEQYAKLITQAMDNPPHEACAEVGKCAGSRDFHAIYSRHVTAVGIHRTFLAAFV